MALVRPTDRPPWIDDVVPDPILAASRLPWGFHNESWIVTGPDGRQVVATRFVDGTSRSMPTLLAALQPRLAAVGVSIPTVDLVASSRRPDVIVVEMLDGEPGAALLGADSGSRLIGAITGRAWRHLADVDPTGLQSPRLWSQSDRLVKPLGPGPSGRQWTFRRMSRRPSGRRSRRWLSRDRVVPCRWSTATSPRSTSSFEMVGSQDSSTLNRRALEIRCWMPPGSPGLSDSTIRVPLPTRGLGSRSRRGSTTTSPTVAELLGVLPIVRLLELLTCGGRKTREGPTG